MGHHTSPAALALTEDYEEPRGTGRRQYEACLECLTGIDAWLASTEWSPRVRAAMVRHLHYLLQFLTITTTSTLRTAPRPVIDAWLLRPSVSRPTTSESHCSTCWLTGLASHRLRPHIDQARCAIVRTSPRFQ